MVLSLPKDQVDRIEEKIVDLKSYEAEALGIDLDEAKAMICSLTAGLIKEPVVLTDTGMLNEYEFCSIWLYNQSTEVNYGMPGKNPFTQEPMTQENLLDKRLPVGGKQYKSYQRTLSVLSESCSASNHTP